MLLDIFFHQNLILTTSELPFICLCTFLLTNRMSTLLTRSDLCEKEQPEESEGASVSFYNIWPAWFTRFTGLLHQQNSLFFSWINLSHFLALQLKFVFAHHDCRILVINDADIQICSVSVFWLYLKIDYSGAPKKWNQTILISSWRLDILKVLNSSPSIISGSSWSKLKPVLGFTVFRTESFGEGEGEGALLPSWIHPTTI